LDVLHKLVKELCKPFHKLAQPRDCGLDTISRRDRFQATIT